MLKRKILKGSLALFVIVGSAFISLRNTLLSSGLVGFTWDWDVPPFAGQIMTKMKLFSYAWMDIPTLGTTLKMASPFYYWILVAPFGFLGGSVLVKAALMITLLTAGISTLILCRYLKFNIYISLIPALFYMFSPLMYSRIIAGHMPIAFGSALIPLFVLFLLRSFDQPKVISRDVILAGIIFSFICQHPMLMGVSGTILFVFVFVELVFSRQRSLIKAVLVPAIILIVFVFLHSFWIIPFIIKMFQKEQISHGGLAYALGKITLANEIPLRMAYLRNCSLSLVDSLRLLASQGMSHEFVYPVSSWIRPLWTISSFCLPIFVFSTLFFKKLFKDKRYLFFLILAFLGVTLTSGVKTPLGIGIYYQILIKLGWIFGEFSNANRWSPLSVFSYTMLLPYFLTMVVNNFPLKRLRRKLICGCIILIVVYMYPFYSGNIDKPILKGSQPLSLLSTQINPQDEKVYNFIKSAPGDFRVSYLPPAALSYVGKPELSYEWTSFYSPKPEFMGHAHAGEPFSQFCVSTMFQKKIKSTQLGKIFGLASLKYIVFPKYKNYYLYLSLDGLSTAGLGEIAFSSDNRLEDMLSHQNDIVAFNRLNSVDTVDIFENKNWLPHIYACKDLVLASGDFSGLVSISHLNEFDFKKTALVFPSTLNEQQFIQWDSFAKRYVIVNGNYIDFVFPFIEDEYKIYPGSFAHGLTDANKGWVNMGFYWYSNWHHATSLIKHNGIFTKVAGEFKFNWQAQGNGKYQVYALVHEYPKASQLSFLVNDNLIGKVDTYSTSDRGFKWVNVGRADFVGGENKVNIKSQDGENAVLSLVIAPPAYIEEKISKFESDAKNKEIVSVYELEHFKASIDNPSASSGAYVLAPLKGEIYVPRAGQYTLKLRLRSLYPAGMKVDIGNSSKVLDTNSSSPKNFHWEMLSIDLTKGRQPINIEANQEVFLDMLYLSLDKDISENSFKSKVEAIKRNPTKYELSIETDKPFFVFFSEAFKSKWKLFIDGKSVPSVKGYGFGNIYRIDKIGQYKASINYVDQRYFHWGQLVTILAWAVLVILLIKKKW